MKENGKALHRHDISDTLGKDKRLTARRGR
jgi:hypothetical protein